MQLRKESMKTSKYFFIPRLKHKIPIFIISTSF